MMGIQAAIINRANTGIGQHVDISMLDCQISMLNYMATMHTMSGIVPEPIGNSHFVHMPYNTFLTKDFPIVITAVGDQLAEEDLLLGVERVNDDVHELVHVRLELELLAILLGRSRRSSIIGLDADVDASPRAGGLRGRAERRRLLLEGGGLRAERGENKDEFHIGDAVTARRAMPEHV